MKSTTKKSLYSSSPKSHFQSKRGLSSKTPSKLRKNSSRAPSTSCYLKKSALLHQSTSHFSTINITLQDSSQVSAIDPQDGTINTSPGYITPENYPKSQHVVSPHVRKYVHQMDESRTPAPRAPIQPEHLTLGYRYLLKHLKYVHDPKRRQQLKHAFRTDFELIRRIGDLPQAEVQFDRTMPNLWSQLSVVRMNISKLRRPKIPDALTPLTAYLGAQEGSGWFCSVPSSDSRFNKPVDSNSQHTIISSRGSQFLEKAKVYNMDLHPADIERHYNLVERFHFNGKERSHRNNGW